MTKLARTLFRNITACASRPVSLAPDAAAYQSDGALSRGRRAPVWLPLQPEDQQQQDDDGPHQNHGQHDANDDTGHSSRAEPSWEEGEGGGGGGGEGGGGRREGEGGGGRREEEGGEGGERGRRGGVRVRTNSSK